MMNCHPEATDWYVAGHDARTQGEPAEHADQLLPGHRTSERSRAKTQAKWLMGWRDADAELVRAAIGRAWREGRAA